MKTTKFKSLLCAALCCVPLMASAEDVVQTRIGELTFTHDFASGYPTDATIDKLFDEIDFQRASQAYIWAIPLISMAQWQYAYNVTLGAENGQIVFLNGYDDILGGLTFNATTPYALVFIDLGKEPWIVHMPEGEVRGAAHDMWEREITSMTKPGKYVFVGPGQKAPAGAEKAGYTVHKTPTNSIFLGIRLIPTDPDERMALLNKVDIYPFAERNKPNPRRYITPQGKRWSAAHPRGMDYWQRLSDIISKEPVEERDRFFMAMLKPLGIEKGKPFNPTDRQKRILMDGLLVGEAMAKAIDFKKTPRLEDAHYLDGSRWDIDTTSPPDQRREHYDALDGRASWFYEAVTNNLAMHGMETGEGQVYLTSYKDTDDEFLDGARNYTLHIPPKAPAKLFWSLTLYEVDGRDIIHNKYKVTDRSSRMDLLTNKDGSVDLYFGPDLPKGKKQNWIPTEPGRAFFAMLRFYSPGKTLLDRSWVLPDIERVK
ncbi:MAG: DUF1254 domain-containing protein [Xanthomonadales bacterium]|nr:DUF1254 domain-containing protein [Xanthomonadales bacterium]